MVLYASISNLTKKPVDYVGVLVEARGADGKGSMVEYEFYRHIAPYETLHGLVGREYAPGDYSLAEHLGHIDSCWARIAHFTDGSDWSVSPL